MGHVGTVGTVKQRHKFPLNFLESRYDVGLQELQKWRKGVENNCWVRKKYTCPPQLKLVLDALVPVQKRRVTVVLCGSLPIDGGMAMR